MFNKTLACLIAVTLLCGCNRNKSSAQTAPSAIVSALIYDLENPQGVITLSDEKLREISGLSVTAKENVFLGIADEIGEAYFLDAQSGAILQSIFFREKGDFEGVELVNETIWALKSDGDLFEITHWNKGKPKVEMYDTPLMDPDDAEGLGFDSLHRRLLIACKYDPDKPDLRPIYAFDLKSKTMNALPVFKIDPLEVDKMLPNGPDDKANYFSPSAIAVHPKRPEIYVLSSAKKRLAVLDSNTGALKAVERINKKLIPQPEGLAFDAEGNLYIASEGKDKEGMIFKFNAKN